MKPLACADVRLLLSDLLAHALEAENRQPLDAHLAACGECRQLAVELFRQDLLLLQAGASSQAEALAGRIHARLTAVPHSSQRRRRVWLVGLAASILVLFGAFFLWRGVGPDAPVVRLDGAGEFFLIDGPNKRAVRSGQSLAAGQVFQTVGDDSRAVLTFGDATELVLGANSILELLNGSRATTVNGQKRAFLREGMLTAQVSKQRTNQPLVLVTPHAELLVLGTRFWVGTTAEATRVEVEEGAVQFRNQAGKELLVLRAGEQAVAAAPAVQRGTPWPEPFDATDHLKPFRGYRSRDPRLELELNDRKEGQASVRADWASGPQGYATGGIEKTFAATDFTGKSFRVWLKPLTPATCLTLAIALYDSRGLRAEVRFIHLTNGEWAQLPLTVGEKGSWSAFQKHAEADLTRISRIEFYGITRGSNQKAAILVDGFEEINGR